MTRTTFSISQASRITGKSRTTLRSYINKGKLSCVEGPGDQRLLDASELTRVFGNDLDLDQAEPAGKRSNSAPAKASPANQSVQTELQLVRQQLEREISERGRERERLEEQLGELHAVLKRTQEGHAQAMLVLETRVEQNRDWEKPLKELQAEIAKQRKEQHELKESAKRKISSLKQELEQERSKPFLSRLFG